MKVNPTRESYSDKFAELIVKYNSGEIETDKLFLELVNFSRGLNEEETRHIRENLSEEELVIFDILTNPQPKLSKTELEEVKKSCQRTFGKIKNRKIGD